MRAANCYSQIQKTMKTAILISFIFLFAFNLRAQIVLDENDLPKAGDEQVSVKVDSMQATTLSPGNAGAGVLWDFSNLLYCCNGLQDSYDTLTWLLPANTAYYNDFPLSNLAYKKDCYKVHSHVTHTDVEYCNYDYCIKNNKGVLLYGYYKTNVKIYDKMRFVFPLMEYGDTLYNDARLIYYSEYNTVKVIYISSISVADGWGTVITPLDTTPALRVQTTEIIYDSIYVGGVGNLQSTIGSNYYFHWYVKDLGFPILQIYKSSLHQENLFYQAVSYASQKALMVNTPEISQNNTIKVINDLQGRAVIFLLPDDAVAQEYFIEMFDISGKKIYPPVNRAGKKISVSFEKFPGGVYLYRIVNSSQILKSGIFAVE